MLSLVLVVTITGCEDEIVIKKTENIETMEVKYDTSKKKIINEKLPEKIEVILTDGNSEKTRNAKVAWSAVDEYYSHIPDTYTFKGAFKIDDTRGVKYVDVKVKPEQDLTKNRISDFEIDVTDRAGELKFQLNAHAEAGINNVKIETSEEQIGKEFSGQKDISFSGIIEADPGTDKKISVEDIKATVTYGQGQKYSETSDHYVRRYDVFEEDKSIEVGVNYWPYMGDPRYKHWENRAAGKPLIGTYSTHKGSFDNNAFNRHIDQMQSAGISRIIFSSLASNLTEMSEHFELFRETDMFSKIDFEIHYDFASIFNSDVKIEKIDSDMEYIKNKMFPLKNYNTFKGRPVVYFYNIHHIMSDKIINSNGREEWDSPSEYVDHLRSQLTVNGVEPYLICDFQHIGYQKYNNWKEEDEIEKVKKLLSSFDAVTTWTGYNPNKTFKWKKQIEFVKKNFKGYEELMNEYDFEFAPRAFPGFDERANDARKTNRYTPRSLRYFRESLELVDEYRTIPHVNIATWNEWEEGHMIEPGYYRGEYYGFDYLNEIKEFIKEK
ncbi:MAG: glycoside hydrolase family 99-like domain-containing protein [bacterium]